MKLLNYLAIPVCLICVINTAVVNLLPPLPPLNNVLVDYDPNETFLSVFLTIYHMNWHHELHFNRILSVLTEFENDPMPLYQDDISLRIVCEQVLFGFINEQEGGFLYNRSRRLLLRILGNRPTRRILNELLGQAALADVQEVSQIIGRFAFEAFNRVCFILSRRDSNQHFFNTLQDRGQ